MHMSMVDMHMAMVLWVAFIRLSEYTYMTFTVKSSIANSNDELPVLADEFTPPRLCGLVPAPVKLLIYQDRILMPERQADVVPPIQQALPPETIDLECCMQS